MARRDVAILNRFAKYLRISPDIKVNKEHEIYRTSNKSVYAGFTTIATVMGQESKANAFAASDKLTKLLITQWLEYAGLYVLPIVGCRVGSETVLQELNQHLSKHSYLVEQSLSIADVIVFYAMHGIMSTLTSAQKETYLNVSRWFEHLQRIDNVRQDLEVINFSVIYLHGWGTGTHA